MVTMAEKWCERHNATLMEMGAGGFTYMLDNGNMRYMTYKELKAG